MYQRRNGKRFWIKYILFCHQSVQQCNKLATSRSPRIYIIFNDNLQLIGFHIIAEGGLLMKWQTIEIIFWSNTQQLIEEVKMRVIEC